MPLYSCGWDVQTSVLSYVYTLLFFLIDLHMSITETTQSARCRLARVNACSWTPQVTWCLQTVAKQETPVGN